MNTKIIYIYKFIFLFIINSLYSDGLIEKYQSEAGKVEHLEPSNVDVIDKKCILQFLSLSHCGTNFYFSLNFNNNKYTINNGYFFGEKCPDSRPNINATILLSEHDAESLYKMVYKEVYKVKYSKYKYKGLDGAKYYFSLFVKGKGFLHGETWSPTRTSELFGFVNQFIKFAKCDSQKEVSTLLRERI